MTSMLILYCLTLAQSLPSNPQAPRTPAPAEPFIKIAAPVGDRWTNMGLSIPFDVVTGPRELQNVYLSCYADCLIVGDERAESSSATGTTMYRVLPPASQAAFSCNHLFEYPKSEPLASAVLTIVGAFSVLGEEGRRYAGWQFQLSTDRAGKPQFTLISAKDAYTATTQRPLVDCTKKRE
jgi:hypothetical protein